MSGGERPRKSEQAFRTIGEVAEELGVAPHVLRFWETRFPQLRPLKRSGGRRYYRPEDVQLLREIRTLLYEEGFTIEGAKKHLKERRALARTEAAPAPDAASPHRQALLEEARRLRGLAAELRALLAAH
ncbi:HTH-type transcriptional repressor BluR [bacterium HR39]|nr:HTH-type transcriptional repressor BluR [bacterium HR39]